MGALNSSHHQVSGLDAVYGALLLYSLGDLSTNLFKFYNSNDAALSILLITVACFVFVNFLRVYSNVHSFDDIASSDSEHFLNKLGKKAYLERGIRLILAFFIVASTKLYFFSFLTKEVGYRLFDIEAAKNITCDLLIRSEYMRCLKIDANIHRNIAAYEGFIGIFVGFAFLLILLVVWDLIIVFSYSNKREISQNEKESLLNYFKTGVCNRVSYIRTHKFWERLMGFFFIVCSTILLVAFVNGNKQNILIAVGCGATFVAYLATIILGETRRYGKPSGLIKQLLLPITTIYNYVFGRPS